MARKTMAERYAAQRSRKDVRRRSLPRLSDTAIALQERDDEAAYEATEDDGSAVTVDSTPAATTLPRRSQRSAMPRRASPLAQHGRLDPATAIPRVNYHYVIGDLRRIAMTAVVMLALLIVLNIVIQNVFVH